MNRPVSSQAAELQGWQAEKTSKMVKGSDQTWGVTGTGLGQDRGGRGHSVTGVRPRRALSGPCLKLLFQPEEMGQQRTGTWRETEGLAARTHGAKAQSLALPGSRVEGQSAKIEKEGQH